MTKIEKALIEALPHVYRQQKHGKHEQDRADASAWLAEYGELVRDLKTRPPRPLTIWCADQQESPTITSGIGAPDETAPVNSIYLQVESPGLWVMLEDGWVTTDSAGLKIGEP